MVRGVSLIISEIVKSFGRFPALKGVSLDAEDGEFLALLGPSGSGKTTLLRVMAGLETPDAGAVLFRGANLLARPARERGIGLVFQHYALFRHMTAADNVAFGMRAKSRRHRSAESVIKARVEELLALVQLEGLGGRYPSQLSGGQRQRVALARALAIDPQLLLLDEPFGALDAKVRRDLRRWLRDLHARTGLTTVFVTHDQEEALELADRIAILNKGEIVQVGTPEDLYARPNGPFTFEFLGDVVRLPCRVTGDRVLVGEGDGCPAEILSDTPGDGPAVAWCRPDVFAVSVGEGICGARAVIEDILLAGPDARIDCRLLTGGQAEVRVERTLAETLKLGQPVGLAPRAAHVWREMPEVT
jgi:sulfate/thiosulfate transport system ATP-binding protein